MFKVYKCDWGFITRKHFYVCRRFADSLFALSLCPSMGEYMTGQLRKAQTGTTQINPTQTPGWLKSEDGVELQHTHNHTQIE